MNIKKLKDGAIIPNRADDGSAGYDLYAVIEEGSTEIYYNEVKLISTGWAMEIPPGYVGLIYARSGLATKQDLALANGVGVVDSSYRGEVKVALRNFGRIQKTINSGDRIAQLVITPYIAPEMTVVNSLSDTDRGDGGFGHTGKQRSIPEGSEAYW